VLWLDAHGDLNSPASSPSKHFHGMPLRFLLEGGLDDAIGAPAAILDPSSLAMIGCRDLDPPEADYIRERGIQIIGVEDSGSADPVALGAPVYVHLDLDVLDPGAYPNVKCPVPGGMSIAAVAALISRAASGGDLVGMSVLENLARDRETIERLEPIFALAERI
jgi:arginase